MLMVSCCHFLFFFISLCHFLSLCELIRIPGEMAEWISLRKTKSHGCGLVCSGSMSILEESKEGRGRNELGMGRLRQDLKNTEVLIFYEHSVQKAWTQSSASDIIHLAREDPVNGRGRQQQSLPRQPAFEAAADSLLFSCCCVHPPSFSLSLFFLRLAHALSLILSLW